MTTVLTYLEQLTQDLHKSEAEILAIAFETGLHQLWRESILGQYLRSEISRDEAIQKVGIQRVELAEHQFRAALEDIEWAVNP